MKAMLLIDMPKWCDNCPCFNGVEDRSDCNLLKKEVEGLDGIDKDCPLKTLPQKKDFEWTDSFGIYNFKKGFNACLDEILGEENE